MNEPATAPATNRYYKPVAPHYNHIIDNIYIGDVICLADTAFISSLSQIVSLVENPYKESHAAAGIEQFEFYFIDRPKISVVPYAKKIFRILDTGLPTLVHCAAGRSRSVAVVIYYLMTKSDMTFDQAYDLVREKRSCADLNKGFRKQLTTLSRRNKETRPRNLSRI